MSVMFDEHAATFSDVVGVADADSVLEWIQQHPAATIDLADCTHLHPAVIQILIVAGAVVAVWPADPDLERWLSILRAKSGATNDHP